MSSDSDYIVKCVTCHTTPIKTLVEALNGILSDVSLVFKRDGIYVMTMNRLETIYVDLFLDATKFEDTNGFVYNHDQESFVTSIRIASLNKITKTLVKDTIITLFVHKSNPDVLGVKFETNGKGICSIHHIKTIDCDVLRDAPDLSASRYQTVISMPSAFFQKLCRDTGNLCSTKVELKSHKNCFYIRINDNTATDSEYCITENDGNLKYIVNKSSDTIVQGDYTLKLLNLFTKCTTLSDYVLLHMHNDMPLQLEYLVGALGRIKLNLASIVS
jgi:proliferating cell nuclear antigen PCNA